MKKKKKEIKARRTFAEKLTNRIGWAVIAAIPEGDNVKASLKVKGHKRRFLVTRGRERMNIIIRSSGDLDMIYTDKDHGSFIRQESSFEEYRRDEEGFLDDFADKMFLTFYAFYSGDMYSMIREGLESDDDEDDGEEEGACGNDD